MLGSMFGGKAKQINFLKEELAKKEIEIDELKLFIQEKDSLLEKAGQKLVEVDEVLERYQELEEFLSEMISVIEKWSNKIEEENQS